jgi:hypothetical protein
MTKEWKHALAENTKRIARLLSGRMPHLEFAFWDLSDFMPAFHNVRRNIIFIECERLAHKEVISALADKPELRNYLVYLGDKKPVTINEAWASAKSTDEIRDVIVVVARTDFYETDEFEGNARIPRVERRLVDLLAYSLKGCLPFTIEEAFDALEWGARGGRLKITTMQRYATRRYVGWFFDILMYRMNERDSVPSIDPRYVESGKRYYDAVLKVGKHE